MTKQIPSGSGISVTTKMYTTRQKTNLAVGKLNES
jgi:hypothetical protein